MTSKLVMDRQFCIVNAMKQEDSGEEKAEPPNESPVKAIKSPDGDIIDCIHIHDQPAFDHPLLKNHAILDDKITQLWQLNGRCPEGTIPIRRYQNPSNLKRYAKKKHKNILQISPIDDNIGQGRTHVTGLARQRAFAYVQGGKYFGTKAYLNLSKPQVQNEDFSSSQTWILGIPYAKVNSIEAGWMVLPDLYGDNTARLFTYWTIFDSLSALDLKTLMGYHSNGCYKLDCPGFVHTNPDVVLGGGIYRISTHRGPQHELGFRFRKDPKQDVWGLAWKTADKIIGYWPASHILRPG
ncbi:unnamed protein product [Coffea canephora]|uniref:Neprosin PEP catalytic domain-containing protein n=1 Tax=Coffea canephora TaxID=49390 RepID=A0A068UX39_COFCA|nr:unnamed protein product [Coffea canephora]